MSHNQENTDLTTLQQQLQETRQLLEQLMASQQAAMPQNTPDPQMMMDSSHLAPSPWHSLDRDLFSTEHILTDDERRELIEAYPALRNVEYKPPSTLPTAHRCMNKAQQLEDSSLRDLQYLLSGVFRPLDVLGNEMLQSTNAPSEALERHLGILNHARTLLISACATITHNRNKIAMRAVNPRFTAPAPGVLKKYTMDSEDFHQAITQQTSAAKALREARIVPHYSKRSSNEKFSRPIQFGNSTLCTSHTSSTADTQPFFRPGPSSQHGGYTQQYAYSRQQGNRQTTSTGAHPKNNNPFRQQSGRLQLFSPHWDRLFHKNWVNTVVQHDFKIPFHTLPPLSTDFTPHPHQLSKDQQLQLDQVIQDLLTKQAIEPVPHHQPSPGFVSLMFTIPKKTGGCRPVFNLRTLNQYVDCPHFKMETIQQVSLMVQPGDYMTSIDLSDTFLHLSVHPEHRPYLRFHWKGSAYQFKTTPFGLSIVPYWFTKITKPILEWARQQGIRLNAYLDDWIILGKTKAEAMRHTQLILQCLTSLGWLINLKKSQTQPTQTLEHLGFELDSQTMTARLPGKKLRDLRKSIQQLIKQSTSTPRTIQSVIMRIQVATFAIFPARFYTQHLLQLKNHLMKSHPDWDRPHLLSKDSIQELQWWLKNLKQWNGRSLLPSTQEHTLYVDASNTGSPDVHQLTRIESRLPCPPSLPSLDRHNSPDSHGQHYLLGLHQQARGNEIIQPGDPCNNPVEVVPSTRSNAHIQPRIRYTQLRSGLRVKKIFYEKSLASETGSIQQPPSVSMGSSRGGSVCRQDKQPPRKVRVVETRSRSMEDRCFHHSLEQPTESVRQPPLEPDLALPGENSERKSPSNHTGSTLLAVGNLVPSATTSGSSSSSFPVPHRHTNHHDTDAMASPASVEALRLEALGASSSTPGLTAMSTSLLRTPRLMDTTTNKSYKRGQTLFIEWALAQDISLTSFTDIHLTNFLSAPPQPIHRPTIDMSPSLKAVRLIDINDLSTPLPHLQQKLAFLLGMAAFLRPSDLHRIDFAAANIEIERNCQYLSFQVVAPKGRRAGRRIIKPFRVYSHQDPSLCPVATFQAIRDHLAHLIPQPTVTSFFVNTNTNMTKQIVKVTTINSWIRRLIRLSTSEPRVNLRSLASSAALRAGIDLDDIITLGNWSSSTVFEQHYRREHLTNVDFTNTVLPVPEDEETFHDACSNFDNNL
ncbi:hypothetical protein G6F66_010889 [Rhizopus arrhizus]|nr:hypothetical protein G6F66_010889 [Rhizopus arrhizus]